MYVINFRGVFLRYKWTFHYECVFDALISIDFIIGNPQKPRKKYALWVVVDRLPTVYYNEQTSNRTPRANSEHREQALGGSTVVVTVEICDPVLETSTLR